MERDDLERIIDAVCSVRCGAADTEEMLHERIAQAFCAAGIAAQHEARLAPRCRIDFLADHIGIEIKKSKPPRTALMAQLSRYAACDQVNELLVIAPRGVDLPRTIAGKRLTMLALERLWGICLP